MFSEGDALIMIIAAVSKDLVAPILEGLAPFYNENSGVVFVSDIEVTRVVKFTDDSDPEFAAEFEAETGSVVEEDYEPAEVEESKPKMDSYGHGPDPEPDKESEPEFRLDLNS